jgi:hypothetical protein
VSQKRDEGADVPDDFSEDARKHQSTEERIKDALASGPVEVNETDSFARRFNQKAAEDTGDSAWGGGIIGRMYQDDDPSEEVASSTDQPSPLSVDDVPEIAEPSPNLHDIGSVDSENPIQFISSPLDLAGGGAEDTAPAPHEPAPPVSSAPSAAGGMDFLADLEISRDEPVAYADEPMPAQPLDAAAPIEAPSEPQCAPTEEVPAPILEDLAQPSIVPSMSRGVGYSGSSLEETIGVSPPERSDLDAIGGSDEFEARILRKKLEARAQSRATEDDEDDENALPVLPMLVLAGLLVGVAGVGFLIFNLSMGPNEDVVVEQAISGDAKPQVDLPVVTFPSVMGEGPRVIPDNTTPVDPMQAPLPEKAVRRGDRAEDELYQEPEPQAAPSKSRVAPTGVAALTARIQVSSNQRAMISLDGAPQAPAPLELRVTPGTHTLTAMLPGRPDSIQTKEVTAKKNKAVQVGFVF